MAKQPSVLIVDENADSRVELRKLLQRAGFTVSGEARYGVSASSAAGETLPDAVLVGIEDPPNRALETIEGLARLLLETPVIAYSTMDGAADVRRAVRAGVRDYLVRPLAGDDLRAAIFAALEQEEQRQLRRAGHATVAVRGTVVAVSGAKGGVGKSVVAINLALALRQVTGRTVALVDADTHFGDVATMLNLAPAQPVTTLIGTVARMDRAGIAALGVAHASGVQVYTGPADPDEWRGVTPDRVERFIDLLSEAYDFVVIDTPDVFDPVVEQCVRSATMTLLVTSMDLSSVSDTKVALRILQRWDCPTDKVRLVLNLTRARDDLRPADVQQALDRSIAWTVPYDRRVPSAAQVGDSLVFSRPKSAFAGTFRDLAAAVSGMAGPGGRGPVASVRRLLRWAPVRVG